jgi:hypothetical protein
VELAEVDTAVDQYQLGQELHTLAVEEVVVVTLQVAEMAVLV